MEAFAAANSGPGSGFELTESFLRVIGSFPISTLATFPGTGFDQSAVEALVRRVHAPD
jgi:hypothetical protein